jgi:pSer/pThr/pTyr-binding forkhead associated (FHA) protein
MNDTEKTPKSDQITVLDYRIKDNSVENDGLEPYLVILSGQDQGKQYRLYRKYNTFGRTHDVDIMITDAKISRKHGVFIIHPDCIVLEDCQSTNGCFVDGIRIERQIIELTARIQVGNTLMKIEYKKASEVESETDLYKAANVDALTNIPNRRAFMIRAQEEFSFCKRNNCYLTIIMLV